MGDSLGERLIQEMLSNPAKFEEQGRAYELLQEYFCGFSLKTLHPLLTHQDKLVQRGAVWIASELGIKARSLIHDTVPLVYCGDRYIQFYALEVVIVCSVEEDVDEFVHVVRAMQNADEVIRIQAMYLMSNADSSQLEAGVRLLESSKDASDKLHRQGLSSLLNQELLNAEEVEKMIDDEEPLIRKYGAMALKRLAPKFPELVIHAISSTDADVHKFFAEW